MGCRGDQASPAPGPSLGFSAPPSPPPRSHMSPSPSSLFSSRSSLPFPSPVASCSPVILCREVLTCNEGSFHDLKLPPYSPRSFHAPSPTLLPSSLPKTVACTAEESREQRSRRHWPAAPGDCRPCRARRS